MSKKIVTATVAAHASGVAVLALTVAPAAAQPGPGRDYGQHVAACAQAHGGFTGSHNPGMHQGFRGWDGTC